MNNRKIIKLTKQQLNEAECEAFTYLNGGDFKEYNGYTETSSSGKENNNTWGEPNTTDELGKKIAPSAYNRYAGFGAAPQTLREDDKDNDNVDDFYNHEELDTLSDGDESDDLTKIPQGVDRNVDILINSMRNLSPKQHAIVLNKLIEELNLEYLPYSWLKELRLKINSKK